MDSLEDKDNLLDEDEDYIYVPMFEEFAESEEFPTKFNDLFGVML